MLVGWYKNGGGEVIVSDHILQKPHLVILLQFDPEDFKTNKTVIGKNEDLFNVQLDELDLEIGREGWYERVKGIA